MASKDKVFERRNKILTELESGPVSVIQIAEIVGVSRRTVESDVKALKAIGTEIEIKNDIITLKKRGEVVKESTVKDIRAISILMLLGENINGLTKMEIEDELLYDIIYDLSNRKERRRKESTSYSELINKKDAAFRKRVEEDLKRLVEQKKINKVGNRYFIAMNSPVQISLSDRNLDAIYKELVNNCDQNTFGDILFQITRKVYDAIELKLHGEEIRKIDNIILQNEKSCYDNYENVLKQLFSVNYKGKRIKIKGYNRYKKPINDMIISIGIIVFISEEGSFYVIGKTDNDYQRDAQETKNWKKHYSLVKLSRVEKIEENVQDNFEYGKEEYVNICKEMYKSSVENSFNVTLEYRNSPRNQKKVRRFEQDRDTFVIKDIRSDVIVCTDRVRGTYDYKRFLRKEGNDVMVTYPPFLVSDMADSAKRIIKRYNDE